MRTPDDRSIDQPTAEQDPIGSEDSFAPGGEPRAPLPVDVGPVESGMTDEIGEIGEDADAVVDATGAMSAEALSAELSAAQDRFLRLAAEYDNFRRRSQRERQEAATRGQAELVKSLLDPFDDLDRFANLDPGSTTASIVIEGVEMVERKMAGALRAAGLEIVDPVDAPFDPAVHEAVATTPAASADEDSTVSQVYQLGYVFAGQLLRPARVVVRQWQG
ncbi:MAG: nucleotide exchange factor GrpE [Gemmatimonadaceae bacterium]